MLATILLIAKSCIGPGIGLQNSYENSSVWMVTACHVALCSESLTSEVERNCPTGQANAAKTSTMIEQKGLLKYKGNLYLEFKFIQVVFKCLILNHSGVIRNSLLRVCKAPETVSFPSLCYPLSAREENSLLGISEPEWAQSSVTVWLTLKVPELSLLDPRSQA